MAPIPITQPPTSPSLIDLAPQQPKPTLLDDVDYTLFLPPPPPKVDRPPPPRFLPPHLLPPPKHGPIIGSDRLVDVTPAKIRGAQNGTGQTNASDPRLNRQWRDAYPPASATNPSANPLMGRLNVASDQSRPGRVERLLAAKPFVPSASTPTCPQQRPAQAAYVPAQARQQHSWKDPIYGPNSYENDYTGPRFDNGEADAVKAAIAAGLSARRDYSHQLQLLPSPTGQQEAVHPPPARHTPALSAHAPSYQPTSRGQPHTSNLRPEAHEYHPGQETAYNLWSNQPPWNRDPGQAFASLPYRSAAEGTRTRLSVPALSETHPHTYTPEPPLRFELEPDFDPTPRPAEKGHSAPSAVSAAALTASKLNLPTPNKFEKALAALQGGPGPAGDGSDAAYEELLSALRRFALEPPVGAQRTGDTASNTAQVGSSAASEVGAGLSKNQRKKARARLAKAQEEEERDRIVRTLLQAGTPSLANAVPQLSYGFDYPSLQPSTSSARRSVNDLSFAPFRANLDGQKGSHITPPELESPPDTLPLSRSDKSIDEPASKNSIPVDVDDPEPFLSDLVGLPGTGNFSEDKAIILSTEEELIPLFKSDIKAIPFPKIDLPAVIPTQPVKVPQVLRSGAAGASHSQVTFASNAVTGPSTAVAKTTDELQKSLEGLSTEERLDRVLAYLGVSPTAPVLTAEQADRHVAAVLDKYTSGPAAVNGSGPRLQIAAGSSLSAPPGTSTALAQPQPFRPSALAPAFNFLASSASKEPDSGPSYDLSRYDSNGLSRTTTQDSYQSDQLYTPEWTSTQILGGHDYTDPVNDYDQYLDMALQGGFDREGGGSSKDYEDGGLQLNTGQSSRAFTQNAARARWQNSSTTEAISDASRGTTTSLIDAPPSTFPRPSEGITDVGRPATITIRQQSQVLKPNVAQRSEHTQGQTTHAISGKDVAPYDLLLALPPARKRVPASLLEPSHDSLQQGVMYSWMAAESPESQKLAVAGLTERLTKLVNRFFGSNQGGEDRFMVDVFGSVSWDGDTGKGGDLDMVVRDHKYPEGCPTAYTLDHPDLWNESAGSSSNTGRGYKPLSPKLSPVHDIRQLVNILRQMDYRDVQGIPGATTPIVKFRDPSHGFDCDLNVNDLGGWYNSKLILAYCEISPFVLRPLIHVLKTWSKANHVNDPSGSKGPASMSSYCLTLMAIGYLQHLGALPNLQANVEERIPEYPEDLAPDVVWAGYGREHGTKIHVGFSETAPPGWQPRDPTLTAARAIRGFFEYFTPGSQRSTSLSPPFDYATQIISIANGGVISRAIPLGGMQAEVQRRRQQGLPDPTKQDIIEREARMGKAGRGLQPNNWSERRLVVHDPFIWQKNCTQAMSKAGLDRWMLAVRNSHVTLSTMGSRCSYEQFITSRLAEPARTQPMAGRGRISSPVQHGVDRAGFAARPPSPGPGYGRGGGMGMGRNSPGMGLRAGGVQSVRPPVGNGGLWRG